MNSFRDNRLRDYKMPMGTTWLLTDIAEYKGKQEMYARQSPQVLKALRDSATIQSVESSNRIEGVTVAHDRLHALKKSGDVTCRGHGPGARWRVVTKNKGTA